MRNVMSNSVMERNKHLMVRKALLDAGELSQHIQEITLDAQQWITQINPILTNLGQLLEATSLTLWTTNSDSKGVIRISPVFEWSDNSDISTTINDQNKHNISLRNLGLSNIHEDLIANKVLQYTKADFPEDTNQILFTENGHTILLAPYMVSGHWHGFICISDQQKADLWADQDIVSLRQFMTNLGNRITEINEKFEAELTENRQRSIESILNSNEITEKKIEKLLALGNSELNLDVAIVSNIVDETYTVKYFYPPESGLSQGQVFDLGVTYCVIAIKHDQVLGIHHMQISEHFRHPCYSAFGLEAYIGTRINVKENFYGTVNFSSPNPHDSFSEADKIFVQNIGKAVSSIIEAQFALTERRK